MTGIRRGVPSPHPFHKSPTQGRAWDWAFSELRPALVYLFIFAGIVDESPALIGPSGMTVVAAAAQAGPKTEVYR